MLYVVGSKFQQLCSTKMVRRYETTDVTKGQATSREQ